MYKNRLHPSLYLLVC